VNWRRLRQGLKANDVLDETHSIHIYFDLVWQQDIKTIPAGLEQPVQYGKGRQSPFLQKAQFLREMRAAFSPRGMHSSLCKAKVSIEEGAGDACEARGAN
jgi:hypothetical protein